MNKSKLIEVIRTLSTKEFKEFGIFLNGTPHRKTAGVYKLYNYLKKYHPEYPPDKIKKEVVYKKLFKDKGNVNKRIFDLMYSLYHVLENFLLQKELEDNLVDRNFLMLEVLKKRKLDKLFFKKIDQVKRDWEKETPPGIEQLYNDYKLARICYFHPNYSKFPGQKVDCEIILNKIDIYYFVNKLFLSIIIAQNRIYVESPSKIENHLLESIFKISASKEFSSVPQIALLSKLLQAYKTKNFTTYDDYKNIFFKSYELYNEDELSSLLGCFQQSLYENHKNGKSNSLREMFELYNFGFNRRLYIEDGYIDDSIFKDAIYVACAVKEVDWGLRFIKEYSQYLAENNKKNVVQLCKSLLAFNCNNYEEALKHLLFVQLKNPIYASQVKGLQMQCYFELEEYDDLFYNLTRSFSTFLRRNKKLSRTHKDSWLNFIKYSNKLYNVKSEPNSCVHEIKKEINNNNNLNFKIWLLIKANELLK